MHPLEGRLLADNCRLYLTVVAQSDLGRCRPVADVCCDYDFIFPGALHILIKYARVVRKFNTGQLFLDDRLRHAKVDDKRADLH